MKVILFTTHFFFFYSFRFDDAGSKDFGSSLQIPSGSLHTNLWLFLFFMIGSFGLDGLKSMELLLIEAELMHAGSEKRNR
jgi:hypothetical protein